MGPSRRLRFAAPFAVAGLIGAASLVPNLQSAAASPKLAPVTAQQLVARAQEARIDGFTGTVVWTANLGLPDLSALTGAAGSAGGGSSHSSGFDPTSLLSGTHTFEVADAGTDRQRVTIMSTLAETDFIHNGNQAWQWDSASQQITRYVGAPHSDASTQQGTAGTSGGSNSQAAEAEPALTPDQVAAKLLADLSPSTTVTVSPPVYVAHRPAYRLDLAPAAGSPGAAVSTIGHVSVAFDSATGVPLEVAVYPAGPNAKVALELVFKSFHPGVPPASDFAAPTGAPVITKTVGGGSAHHGETKPAMTSEPTVTGADWAQILTIPAGSTVASPAAAVSARPGTATNPNADPRRGTYGKSHLVVRGAGGSDASRTLDEATTPVAGSTARLLHTALLNALIFPDGHIVAGFVTPAALEAAAAAPASPAAA